MGLFLFTQILKWVRWKHSQFSPLGWVQSHCVSIPAEWDDHRRSIMEVFLLAPFEGERPPPAKMPHLGVDEPWTDASDLGLLGKVFDQDVFNMERVQIGLEMTRKPGVTLAGYREAKVRWFNDSLNRWLEQDS
jgi:hypothetical protein